MFKHSQRVSLFPALLLCLLLLLMTACSSIPTNSGAQAASTPAASATATNGTPSTNGGSSQMPQTDTSCPSANTARAAVMRPLTLGSHQNLVYIYNDVPPNTSTSSGVLRRYDTATGQKVDIATSGLRIDQAQVSRDGQWVLFLSIPDPRGDSQHSAMLQLVRMDGQGLQTLFCFSNVTQTNATRLPISLQWSEDQKSILFSVNTNHDTSQIFLLDVASGSLRQLFLDQHDSLYSYSVVTWLDATNFYVIKQGTSAPTPPATVFLMNASTATVAHPGLVNILTTNTRMSDFSLDSSSDGTRLYSSSCLLAGAPLFSTTIMAGPAKGHAEHPDRFAERW
jgi:Tol biopolymer transport system component